MRFNLIGAGRLGMNLAKALIECTGAQLLGVCNRSLESAAHAVHELQQGQAVLIADLPAADVTFITVTDAAIASVVAALVDASVLVTGHYVLHCSGVLTSAILAPLRQQGVLVASAHPLRPFVSSSLSKNCLESCYFGVEGDEAVLVWLSPILQQCGAMLAPISAEGKALYHAAAVFASNYPLALAAVAEQNFVKAGISDAQAKAMTLSLMKKMIENYQSSPSATVALTGPIARGDIETLRLHLTALSGDDALLYRVLGLQTLALTAHSEDLKARLAGLLCLQA